MTVIMPSSREFDYAQFIALAEDALDLGQRYLRANISTVLRDGRWHPTGFAVFNVLDISPIGIIRLHYWPEADLRLTTGHPTIHCHCFHLHSRVLAGVYKEVVFRTRKLASNENTERNALAGFNVVPPSGDGIDRLERDDDSYVVLGGPPAEYRSRAAHSIPAGEYHSTNIRVNAQCATLAMLSRPVIGYRDHIIGNRDFATLESLRPVVDCKVTDALAESMRTSLELDSETPVEP
ncbi:hypothetical protein [Gordonia sp. ABSL49_1]|uniref:hypothetical protein n=1 Tax=Gordonia sp. ABSL49_1 TaxID=2920941 RepID=UPI001F0DAC7D|nr:hypothetical protein [Gordonia sp. ABSL49_1]MCH5644436.1 hypothetical protein [Gordonia sp. ABSL49_1]